VSSKKDGELSVAVNDVVTISSKQNSKAWTANFRGSLGKIPSGNLKVIENYDKGLTLVCCCDCLKLKRLCTQNYSKAWQGKERSESG